MDVVLLSRIQFAFTIAFHYLFPPLTIGMGIVLAYLDFRAWRTGDPVYESAVRFWTKLFALNFGLGVATGIVMEFEFGTNWAVYSRFVGDVFGSALAAEGIFAFFLESGFLAVLVFGWNRVSPGMHFFSTCMVALGSIFSSFWIVIANSWQQTPAGHHIVPILRDGKPWIVDGQPMMRAEIVDFWAMVLNPSTVHRLTHVLLGCFVMGAFFVLSISAWYLLQRRHQEFARRSFRGALALATFSSIALLVSGHFQANNVYETQPAKLAAFEGHFETGPADLILFGIPRPEEERVDFAVGVPGGLSFLVHENFEEPVVGLDKFRPEDRPPVIIPFVTYHLMIAIGMFFLALTITGSLLLRGDRLFRMRPLLWLFAFAVIPAVVANQAGWIAAEVGRQPWIVHPPVHWEGEELVVGEDGTVEYDEGVALRTTDAVSRAVKAEHVLTSLILFGFVYLLLGVLWLFLLDRKIKQGPDPPEKVKPRRRGGKFLEAAGTRETRPLSGGGAS